MSFKIGDPRVDFIIQNYDKVESLNECVDICKQRTPATLQNYISKLLHLMDFIDIEEDGDTILFYLPSDRKYYDDEIDFGLYFYIENFKWEQIISKRPEDGIWLACCIEKKPRNQKFKKWWNQILALKGPLNRKDYLLWPDSDDDDYIAAKYLNDILGIHSLRKLTEEELENKIRKTIKEFVEYFTGKNRIIKPIEEKKTRA